MKAKRFLSLLLTLLMALSMLSGFAVSAGAAESTAPAAPPEGTIFVNLGWTESNTPASITVNGKTFALTWGTNAFSTAQGGLDAAPADGTVYLCAGTYGGFNIQKNLTVLGAKYGIDPNVKGTNETDLWTKNSARGTGETIINGNISMGVNDATVHHAATDMTVDGVQLTDGGQIRSNAAAKNNNGLVKITLKNFYIKDSTKTTAPLYLQPYYGMSAPTDNKYQRDVTIKNVRVEGQQTKEVMVLTADKADISGVYMHTDCTKIFFSTASAATGYTSAVEWNIHDNMFANPVGRTIYVDIQSAKGNSQSLVSDLANRSKVTFNFDNNIFVNSFVASGTNAAYTLAFRPATQNVYLNFNGNVFYNTKSPGSSHSCIAGYASVSADYSDQITVKNNKFIGQISNAYSFGQSKGAVDVSGNYYENDSGKVAPIPAGNPSVQDWWYLDRALTQRSDEAGIIAPLPDGTIFVDQNWTETSTPASITVNRKTFTLTWGTNAFATAQGGLDKAANCGTVYLCAGTYGGFHIRKNIRILGTKYGINPNVKGKDELTPWTLNPERGEGETILNNMVHMGANGSSPGEVYHDATDITIDGVLLTGNAHLRSNNGAANNHGIVKFSLKNIYLKNCSKNQSPFYLSPVYGYTSSDPSTNAYRRNVTIKDIRVEGLTGASLLTLNADKADFSGIYMHTDCTQGFVSGINATGSVTDEVTYKIYDSMFCAPVYRVIYLNHQSSIDKNGNLTATNGNIGKRQKVSSTVENCVFLDSHKNNGSLEFTLAFATNTENVYYTFKNNTFVTTTAPTVTSYAPLAGYTEDTTKKYGSKITVKNNKFIGCNNVDWNFGGAGEPVDVSGNYTEDQNGVVSHLSTGGPVLQDWWWMDEAMTQRSDGADIPADRLVDIEKDLKWLGRTYVDDNRHYFNWTNSGFEFNIDGTGATALLSSSCPSSNRTYLKIYVDGVETKTVHMTAPVMNVTLAEGLSDGPHTIKVVKRTNGRSSTAALMKLWVDEGTEILGANKAAGRKIQFLGDSITVGYGSMDWLSPSAWSTDSEDGTITYAALTSKYFGADNHTVAVSGRGVIWNTGGNKDTANHAPLMYEYTDWNNHAQWDHSLYQPDVVVINLGTNDKASCVTADDQTVFQNAAYNLIDQVRKDNPDAYIIWAFGAMGDGNNVEANLKAAVAKHNSEGDNKVTYLHMGTGTTCLGHPTSAAHVDRANELIAKIEEITGWDEHTECDYEIKATTAPTADAEGYGEYTCKVCGDFYEGTIPALGAVSVNGKAYDSLTDALAEAKADDVVVLNKDASLDHLALSPEVVLDLNGNTLSAEYAIGFATSAVIDSSKDNSGRLDVDEDKVALDKENNGYLPVFDGDAYKFITVTMREAKASEAGETYYYFSPNLLSAHDELANGSTPAGLRIVVRLSWSKAGNYTATQDFIYMDELVKDVVESYNEDLEKHPMDYAQVFKAIFAGTEAGDADDLMISAVLISDAGVEVASNGISFAA